MRTRVTPAWEEARGGGRLLEVGLPATARWLGGFRVPAPPPQPRAAARATPLAIRVVVQPGITS